MAQSMTFTRNASGGGLSISQTTKVTGDNTLTYETAIEADKTDEPLVISLDVDKLAGYYIICDGELTIETNAIDATGGNTIVLIANQPLIWTGLDAVYYTGLITLDVTIMYLTTTASGSTRNLKMIFVQDATV